MTSTAAVVIDDNAVEFIGSLIGIDDVSPRFNAKSLSDAPVNLRYGQHVVGADRRLCILQSGA